MEFGREPASLC